MKIKHLFLFCLLAWQNFAHAADWSGYYGGLVGGGQSIKSDWKTNMLVPSEISRYTVPIDTRTSTASFKSTGPRVSLITGYNITLNQNWIVGAETDISFADNKKIIAGIPGTTPVRRWPDSTSIRTTFGGSVRGKFGYSIYPDWLVYTTGGLAVIRSQTTENCPHPGTWCGDATHIETYSKAMVGWTAGIGTETFINEHLIARVEYRYSDYGSYTHTFLPPHTSDDNTATVRIKSAGLNFGLLYKF